MIKTNLITSLFWLIATALTACPLCDKRQPKGFAGITHGTGPENAFDYWMLYGSIAVVVLTLLLFIRFIVRPDTIAMNHLKANSFTDWQHE